RRNHLHVYGTRGSNKMVPQHITNSMYDTGWIGVSGINGSEGLVRWSGLRGLQTLRPLTTFSGDISSPWSIWILCQWSLRSLSRGSYLQSERSPRKCWLEFVWHS